MNTSKLKVQGNTHEAHTVCKWASKFLEISKKIHRPILPIQIKNVLAQGCLIPTHEPHAMQFQSKPFQNVIHFKCILNCINCVCTGWETIPLVGSIIIALSFTYSLSCASGHEFKHSRDKRVWAGPAYILFLLSQKRMGKCKLLGRELHLFSVITKKQNFYFYLSGVPCPRHIDT